MILENKKLKEENKKLKEEKNNDALKKENKKLKLEKEHLKIGLRKFTRGKHLQSELLMNIVMKMDRNGIGYLVNQEKKAQAQQQHKSKLKPKRCFKCEQEDHFAMSAKLHHHNPCPSMLDLLLSMLITCLERILVKKMKVMFLGPPNKNRPKKIWVTKSLVEKVKGPHQVWVSKHQA